MAWDFTGLNPYDPKTTIWDDLTVAEEYGKENIESCAAAAFENYKDDYVQLTELIMALNHKSWAHTRDELCSFYSDLYYKYDGAAIDYLESTNNQEGLDYFFKTLD